MSTRLLAAAAMLCAATPVMASSASGRSSAEAFLHRVYAPYLADRTDYDPAGDDAASVFAPAMIELFRLDHEAAGGEIGYLDGDPVCDCQDFGEFRILSVAAAMVDPRHARATVRFRNLGTLSSLRYSLVMTPVGWRVADVSTRDAPSLAGEIRRWIRESAAARR